MQLFTRLGQKQSDQLVSAACQNKRLIVVCHPVASFFFELFQGIHPHLRRKFMLQELSVHQFSTCLSLYQHERLNDVVVGEETQSRGLFIYIPNYNTLIVRTTNEGLPILRNCEPPNPVLVPGPRALAVPRAYLPKLYSFITGAREHHVPLGVEQDKADVVVMPEKSLEAEIVVVEVPELDGEIRRAAGDIPALVIVADVIDRIYVRQESTCVSLKGAFEIPGLKLPDLDGPVFGGGSELCVLRVKSESSDVSLMTFEFEFGWSFGQVQVLEVGVDSSLFLGALGEIVLQVLDLFLQVVDFLLETQDGLPFEFQFVAFGVDICQTGPDFLRENLCSFRVLVFDQVFQYIPIELVLLAGRQHHLQINCDLILQRTTNIRCSPCPHHITCHPPVPNSCLKGLLHLS